MSKRYKLEVNVHGTAFLNIEADSEQEALNMFDTMNRKDIMNNFTAESDIEIDVNDIWEDKGKNTPIKE